MKEKPADRPVFDPDRDIDKLRPWVAWLGDTYNVTDRMGANWELVLPVRNELAALKIASDHRLCGTGR